jgi:hypothetical protein
MMRRALALSTLALAAAVPPAAHAQPAPPGGGLGSARGVAPFELIDRAIYVPGSIWKPTL